MKVIKLPVFDIVINLNETPSGTAGGIGSSLADLGGDDIYPAAYYNAAVDGLESLILAHACAGVDVEAPGYLEGIETAVQAICDNIG
jgi:hypothetical protein